MLKVLDDPLHNIIGTIWVANEEPVVTKLIIDRELLTLVRKGNPGFSDVIAEKLGDYRAREFGGMIASVVPENRLGQRGEAPAPVMHSSILQLSHDNPSRFPDRVNRVYLIAELNAFRK